MAKFHVNPENGVVGKCGATTGPCPFGDASEHFSSRDEALYAFEASMVAKTLPAPASGLSFRETLVEGKKKDLIEVSDTLHSLAWEAEEDGDGETAEALRLYSSEILGWARGADWSSSEAREGNARGLLSLQNGLESMAYSSAASSGREYLHQAAGSFEQALEGLASLYEEED